MITIRNSFRYPVGKIKSNKLFMMRAKRSKNFFVGSIDGWMLDNAVVESLKQHHAKRIKLYDEENKIAYYVSMDHFLDRCETIESKYGLLYILPEVRWDYTDPEFTNWPIPYAE